MCIIMDTQLCINNMNKNEYLQTENIIVRRGKYFTIYCKKLYISEKYVFLTIYCSPSQLFKQYIRTEILSLALCFLFIFKSLKYLKQMFLSFLTFSVLALLLIVLWPSLAPLDLHFELLLYIHHLLWQLNLIVNIQNVWLNQEMIE